MKAIAATALLSAGAVGCAANSNENASPSTASTWPTADTAVDGDGEVPPFAVAQYWPGTDRWPPPEPIGPQYWPGTDHWPPPEPIGPQYWPDAVPPRTTGGSTSDTVVAEVTTTAIAPSGSTIAQDPEVRAEVSAQVGVAEAAYDRALRNPENPALIEAVEEATAPDSPARAEFVEAYIAFVEAGQYAKPDPEVPNSVTILPDFDPILLLDATIAVVVVCAVSGDTLMGRDESGTPVTVADVRNARIVQQEFHLIDDQWRLYERIGMAIFPEGASCDEQLPSSSES